MIQAGIASQTQAMPVVKVSQNNLLRLMLPVPEDNVVSIHNGQQVTVNVPALHRTFEGTVTRFADRLQMSTRTMTAEVDVKNPQLTLIPGMYARGKAGNGAGHGTPPLFPLRPSMARGTTRDSSSSTAPAWCERARYEPESSRPSTSRFSPESMLATL